MELLRYENENVMPSRYIFRKIFSIQSKLYFLICLLSMNSLAAPLDATEQQDQFIDFDLFEGYPEILFYGNIEFQGEPEFILSSAGLSKGSELVCKWNGASDTLPADEMLINSQSIAGSNENCDRDELVRSGYLPCGGSAFLIVYYDKKLTENRFSKLVENRKIYFEITSDMASFYSRIYDSSDSDVKCP